MKALINSAVGTRISLFFSELGPHAGNLLGIQGEIVTQHTRGFFGCHLGHQGNVIED